MLKQTFFKMKMESLVGISVLLLFAMTFSYLMINVLATEQPSKSYPDWQSARWIKAGEISGNGYFRKSFNVVTLPHRAYFVVSGTEELSVYVNGKTAGSSSFSGARPSIILDVTKLLRVGKNLLAIKVASNVHGVAPELIGRLVLMTQGGEKREIQSDDSWLVTRNDAFQKLGMVDWRSPDYSDLHWAPASMVYHNRVSLSLPLTVPEHVYATFPRGYWIWSGKSKFVILSNEFVVEGNSINDAWLGVSSEGKYSLIVNGITVVSLQGTGTTMELVRISPYLRLGKNTMWLEVENGISQPRLLVSGSVSTDVGVTTLDSTAGWLTLSNTGASLASVDDEERIVRSTLYRDVAVSELSLVYKEVAPSGILSALKILWVLMASLVVSAGLLLGFLFFRRFVGPDSKRTMEACLHLYVRPFALGLVVMCLSLLLRYDPGIVSYLSYQFYVLLMVPVIIVFFEVMIMLEIRHEGDV